MTHQTERFAVVDPRTFDGTSYEVAARAVAQLRALVILTERSIDPARLMIRNAEMDRQIYVGGKPDPAAWENGPQAAILRELSAALQHSAGRLEVLERAAGFDPKAR